MDSVRHLIIGQIVVAFSYWVMLSVAMHQLEPDQQNAVDKDHKHCRVYMASPEYLAVRGQQKSIDTDTCRKYQLMEFLLYEGAWFFITLLILFCFGAPIVLKISELDQSQTLITINDDETKCSYEIPNEDFDDRFNRLV